MSNCHDDRPYRTGPLALVAVLALSACASGGGDKRADTIVDQIVTEESQGTAPASKTFPDLRDVPPRPNLTYSPEQRRQIQEGLVADEQYARYTSQVLRAGDGAPLPAPPEPPPLPEPTVADETAPAEATAPPVARLVERRNDRGDLNSLLDDVVESALPPTTAAGSVAARRRIAPATQPSAPATPAQIAPADETTQVDQAAPADQVPQDQQSAAVETAEPLAVGRLWRVAIDPQSGTPNDADLRAALADLQQPRALEGRRLSLIGRSTNHDIAMGRARAVARDLDAAGVAADRIQLSADTRNPGDVVLVTVLPGGS